VGANRPGPTCTTHGDYVDDGTRSASLSPPPGTVCAERKAAAIPESLSQAVALFQAEAVNFATRFIPDHAREGAVQAAADAAISRGRAS